MRAPALILLAAGASRRMGRPKQLLPWDGATLLRHAAKTACSTAYRPIMVVLGHEAEACARELSGLEIVCAINPEWSRGQGASIASGIKALQEHDPDSPGALLMLVDQPDLTGAFLEEISAAWSENQDAIVATRYPEGGGVPALFPRRFFEELGALDADHGARQIISRERSTLLLQPPGKLIDLDTPEIFMARSRCLSEVKSRSNGAEF